MKGSSFIKTELQREKNDFEPVQYRIAGDAAGTASSATVLRYRKETELLLYYTFQIISMADEKHNQALSPGHLLNEERVLRIPPSSIIETTTEKIKVFNKTVRIATWNVRSLHMPGKLDNVEAEMYRMNINILGLSEVRWTGSGQHRTDRGTIYFSEGTDNNLRYGVAIHLTTETAKSVIDFIPLSDRAMIIKLQTTHRVMNIIQVYAPTGDKQDEDVEIFYDSLDEAISLTKKGEITIVMGDFNAKIGRGAEGDTVGMYGLGEINSRGDRLVQFCNEKSLFVSNTFFKLHPRQLYTWTSPAHKPDKIVRNQIDFILMDHRFKKYVKSVKTYPGSDINSDHNPVVMALKIMRFRKIKRTPNIKRIDIRKLKNPDIRNEVASELEAKMEQIKENGELQPERTWSLIKDAITYSQENKIGFARNNKKRDWMTPEILDLMEKRRRLKRDETKYKEINKVIRKKCREAKEEWMAEKCNEIEALQEKYDTFNVHKKVKEITDQTRKHPATVLKDANKQIIIGIEGKLKRWTEYVETLFNDDRQNVTIAREDTEEAAPRITKREVMYAIKLQKDGKSTGPDGIYSEILKIIAAQEASGLDLLTNLLNAIYTSGKIPNEWLKSTFVTLPKKLKSSQCDDYRMISLMSHVLKVFLRIIHSRIYRKCDYQVDDVQFGFRKGVGTREALFSLNVLTQRCRDMNVDVYACFIDYRKAFDCVKHEKMVEILKTIGLDNEDLRIITELYWNQTAEVRVENSTSEAIQIQRGVRQGCVLSPLLFNIYSEAIFKEALEEEAGGIKVNGKTLNNIRYADDTVVLASSLPELQLLMDRITQHSESFGLFMNTSKTKVMVFSKREKCVSLKINDCTVEQVSSFKYLGTNISKQCDPRKEIRARIEQARKTFISLRTFFIRKDISLHLKIRMIGCYVFTVLLYGCEGWTLDPSTEKRIEAFEMYLYRRILKISWTQRITNIEVLNRMQKQKELLYTIKKRKIQYIGHIMRGDKYEILRLIIEGKIEGKRSIGRRQNSWLKDLRRWLNCTSGDIFRSAVSKVQIAIWIANLR